MQNMQNQNKAGNQNQNLNNAGNQNQNQNQKPKIIIIGGGIAGLALAITLQKMNLPSLVFERDKDFNARNQGYGLTLQQGGKAIKFLGIQEEIRLKALSSRCHFIFSHTAAPVVFWGMGSEDVLSGKRAIWQGDRNLHISRQNLRQVLLEELNPAYVEMKWNSSLLDITETKNMSTHPLKVRFKPSTPPSSSSSLITEYDADVVIGCDGIYSSVRSQLFKTDTPLIYQDHFIMLGIINLSALPTHTHSSSSTSSHTPLLDNRVLQFTDGSTRIFMMPFESGSYMWQLSFPMSHTDALLLGSGSGGGGCGSGGKDKEKDGKERGEVLLEFARIKCRGFCGVVRDVLECMDAGMVTGYPIYDRDPGWPLDHEASASVDAVTSASVDADGLAMANVESGDPGRGLAKSLVEIPERMRESRILLAGDAAHPMTPFKGQGANQALLDAVDLGTRLAEFFTSVSSPAVQSYLATTAQSNDHSCESSTAQSKETNTPAAADAGLRDVEKVAETTEVAETKEVADTTTSPSLQKKKTKPARKKKSYYLRLQAQSAAPPAWRDISASYYTSLLTRTASKQLSSRAQVSILHSPIFLNPADHRKLRGFDHVNNPQLERRLEEMWRDGVVCGWDSADLLDRYAFGKVIGIDSSEIE